MKRLAFGLAMWLCLWTSVALAQSFTGVAQPASALRFSAQQIGNVVTSTATETAFTFDTTAVIPAYTLVPGAVVHVIQCGVYQSGVAQSVQPRIRLGPAATALTSRTVLATTNGAVSGLLNAATDTPWCADTTHQVLSDNTMLSSGRLFFSTSATAALNVLVASASSVSGVDRTVDNVLTATAQWSAASAANQIRATTFFVEVLRP